MICICKPEASIPKDDKIEYFVPIKGGNTFKLGELFNKRCEVHGIRDLTVSNTPATTTEIVEAKEKSDDGDTNFETPSDAENLGSS